MSPHRSLLDAIAANPDDVAPWTVYGDLLQRDSDPRGELISLMLEREVRPSPRLLDIQRELITRHARALAPAMFAMDAARLVWRRGFIAELRVTAPDELARLAAPQLQFADTAILEIDGDDWDDWSEQLAAHKLACRRLYIELAPGTATLELQPVFACFPLVEAVRVKGEPHEAPELVWDGVDARRLERLVLVDCGEIASLDAAELPALRELRLLGQTAASPALRGSLRWSRLEAAVVSGEADAEDAETDASDAPPVHVTEAIDRDVDEESNAFAVVGAAVDLALVHGLVARMPGIEHLSVRLAPLPWSPRPTTVIQLYGRAQADLPYDLAIALHETLAPAPIAMVELDESRGRFLVLGRPAVRDEASPPGEVVRKAIDLALGRDPGLGTLDDIQDELLAAPVHVLIGSGTAQTILNMIDPTVSPLIEPQPTEDDDGDEDYDGDHDDDYDPYDEHNWDDDPATLPSEDPVPVFVQWAAEQDDYGEEEPEPEASPPELGEHDALDCPEVWFAFREHWDDRAVDGDDEPADTRWPDPEQASQLVLGLDHQVALPACSRHELALEHCTWCGDPLCVACEGEAGCARCLAELARPLPPPVPPRPVAQAT